MRADKRSLLNQPSILQLPCRAVDCRHLLLFFLAHGRQDSRQTPRKHRLSGAGRSCQKQIMGSGSCNHCSALCFLHSAQQCKVRRFLFFFHPAFCLTLPSVFRIPPHPFLFLRRRVYILHCFFQAANAHDRQFPNRKPFSQIFKRNQIASKSALICRMQHRQYAPNLLNPRIQPDLAHRPELPQPLRRHFSLRRKNDECGRQIERRPGFHNSCRRIIYRNFFRRKRCVDVMQGNAQTFPRLPHFTV